MALNHTGQAALRIVTGIRVACASVLIICVGFSLWHFIKPMPAGTHVVSITDRVAESSAFFLCNCRPGTSILSRSLNAIDQAQQLILIDNTSSTPMLVQHLLARKRLRPQIKIVFLTDQRSAIPGKSLEAHWVALESAGVIVVRVNIAALRDPNPFVALLWRLGLTTRSNAEAIDRRALIVADNGLGDWTTLLMSADPFAQTGSNDDVGVQINGPLAYQVLNSEMAIARWSGNDDRLPAVPPIEGGGLGSIDVRFLTEGVIASNTLEAINSAKKDTEISLIMMSLSDMPIISALHRAVSRGVRVRVLLTGHQTPNPAVAALLAGAYAPSLNSPILLRWRSALLPTLATRLVIVRNRMEVWLSIGSADLTRRSLRDFNLEANVELRCATHSKLAEEYLTYYDFLWAAGLNYGLYTDESPGAYWRYRFLEVLGGLSN